MFLIKKQFFAAIFLLFVMGNHLQAQDLDNISDDQIVKFLQQAQASGMTETQIEAAALAKGYSPADISKIRDRIGKLGKGNNQTDAKAGNSRRKQMGVDSLQNDNSLDVNKDLVVDKKDSTILKKRAKIFGANIFQNKHLSFEPNLRLPTPRNYVLGADDELNIDITGYAFKHYNLKITPEGTVSIENLSPIYVNGMTIDQAKERIINRLRGIFPGLGNGGLAADVTLGNVRSIKVMIIGEVAHPGTYTVSSLATAFNALYTCGGISENGSLREIEIYRNGKIIRKIDVYDFLLRGDQKDNIQLNDQDVIRVPYYNIHVELNGEVKSPMIFEVKQGETLKNVLDFAGGFLEDAYTKSLNVVRITPTERKMIGVSQNELASFQPQRGDIFYIGKVLERFENKVSIAGAVFREGNYELEKNLTLTQLIKKAEGLREDAFTSRVIIKRERENLDPEILTADLGRILKGELPDIALKREDSVTVKSYKDLREKRTIVIEGAINKAGMYDFAENMTVGDFITMAGGFSDGAAASKIEIARRVKEDTTDLKSGESVRIIPISISRDLRLSNEDAKVTLKPFDKLYVRRLPRYEEQKTVAITGEVQYAGSYTLKDKRERIADLIDKAGGLKSEADLRGARFTRDRKIVSVDLREILKNRDSESNLLLVTGDILDIPRKKETITISGQVLSPITIAYDSKLSFRDYISNAGGYTDSAKISRTYVRYANGSVNRTRNFFFIPIFPKVEQGMEIIVPVKKRSKSLTTVERISVVTGMASLSTAIVVLINYLKK